MISTRDLSHLPGIAELRRLLQSLAMLDAILSPEWQYRYYSFNSHWDQGEAMGSMRNGCGDGFIALFNRYGCFFKGFVHEALMTPHRENPRKLWPGLFSSVPAELSEYLDEPAFDIANTTFCFWRLNGTTSWQIGDLKFPTGDDPDGSEYLLSLLEGDPEKYCSWAKEYYDETWDDSSQWNRAAVESIYDHHPLSNELVSSINSNLTLADLADDVLEIGYPVQNKAT